MDDAQLRIVKDTFEAVAAAYDSPALRFFVTSAAHLARQLGLRGDEQVLDVACGTGHASLALARLLPKGWVTAIDFSPAMLERAGDKAAAAGLGNIDFIETDMQALPWRCRFDAAVCAFGVFFAQDVEAQLARIARTVRPGGVVMISSFAEDSMEPLRSLMVERLRSFGVERTPQTWLRVARPEACRALFATAGLQDIEVEQREMGYALASAEAWWDVVWNAGFRRMVACLAPADQARFQEQHLAEVEALRSSEGIRLDVPVLFTRGTVAR
jgi:ubiquinone/menaquinone biosynthesis C-methylase UbiE